VVVENTENLHIVVCVCVCVCVWRVHFPSIRGGFFVSLYAKHKVEPLGSNWYIFLTFRRLMTYRTANLQSSILYIYSTNIGTEYFKYGIYSQFFYSLQNAVFFHNSNVFGSSIIKIVCTECAKIKKVILAPKG